MKATTLKRRHSLKRTGPLAKVSPTQGKAKKAQGQAYKQVDERTQWCESCGSRQRLSHSHALTQKKWPQFANTPANIFLLCWHCHYCFEHDKRRFAALSPEVWARKLAAIRELAPEQYQLLHIKYPDLIPE